MTVNFDAVIDTPEYAVDMKSGLTTLAGTSDAIRCIGETVLTGEVPKRQTYKGSVRTLLRSTFSGSYGQIFSLEIHNDELRSKLQEIGHLAFSEVIAHYFSQAIYQEYPHELSQRAIDVIADLEDVSEALLEQLRKSAIRNAHEVSRKFRKNLKIRYRHNRDNQTVLATYTSETAKLLEAKKSKEILDLTVVITRLNIHTGNGRLQIEGHDETIAFGFGIEYKAVKLQAKKIFSKNLDDNNGVEKEHWKYIALSATPVALRNGKVIKYIIRGYRDE